MIISLYEKMLKKGICENSELKTLSIPHLTNINPIKNIINIRESKYIILFIMQNYMSTTQHHKQDTTG